MKDEILISILVPVYNQEKYIAKCLNSLIDQTFVFKYQILILDDGSTDNTPKILKRYSRFGSFIKVFHKENEKSIAKARNYLLDKVDTKYFVFVDSDDIVSPYYLEDLYAALRKDNSDISCCGYVMVKQFSNNPNLRGYIQLNRKDALHEMILGTRGQYILWNKLIKTELVKDIRFYNLSYGEDFCFIFDVMQKNVKVAFIQNRLYFYRFFVNRIKKERVDDKKKSYLNKMIEMEKDKKYSHDKALLSSWIYVTASYFWIISNSESSYRKFLLDAMRKRRKIYYSQNASIPKKFLKMIFG